MAAIAGGDFSMQMMYHLPVPKTVRRDIRTPTHATPTANAVSSSCLKCGTSKKSGKRSCCAHGGAWFKNCGDVGDTKFNHTWVEGIQACESRFLGDISLRCICSMSYSTFAVVESGSRMTTSWRMFA